MSFGFKCFIGISDCSEPNQIQSNHWQKTPMTETNQIHSAKNRRFASRTARCQQTAKNQLIISLNIFDDLWDVTNRIHPKHSNCPTSDVSKIPLFICRNCVAFCAVFVFDCIFRFNFSYLSLCYGHGVVMVFCSSWHRSCSVVK